MQENFFGAANKGGGSKIAQHKNAFNCHFLLTLRHVVAWYLYPPGSSTPRYSHPRTPCVRSRYPIVVYT